MKQFIRLKTNKKILIWFFVQKYHEICDVVEHGVKVHIHTDTHTAQIPKKPNFIYFII